MGQRQNRGRNDSGSPSGRLRIVAGKWRSRLLPVADLPGLRPTAERIRETLFNWLASCIDGKRCLDLFAGTGALGFEALSRGAGQVVFVESSVAAVRVLEESASTLAATGTRVHNADALTYLKGGSQPFDIVFLDPPFATDLLQDLCKLLDDGNWLADGARIYLEQNRDRPLPELPAGWTILKEKTAGQVRYALAAISN
jgi:16S rRNA (guanine966-N2)-methyltransferase